jgi:hypothetical protein
MLTLPSALWVIAARCPLPEAIAHLTVGCAQGLTLALVAQKVSKNKNMHVASI